MPGLAELQARIGAALLAADPAAQNLPEALFAGARPGATGLRVHRHTVLGALSHALRLGHGSVNRLVGEDFFDRMAVEYARAAPPRAPQLDDYGADFPDFIDGFPGTANLPYLAELARWDARLEALGRRPAGTFDEGRALPLEGGARLQFLPTLALHGARYPVDALRRAILAEDLAALAELPQEPGEHRYALWRTASGVMTRPLSAMAARFLGAVLAGAEAEAAIAAAAAGADGPDAQGAAQMLAQEILPAGFVRLIAP